MSSVENARLLGSVGMLASLPPEALHHLVRSVDEVVVQRGSHLFTTNDMDSCLYVVKRGRVKLSRESGDGRELVLDVVEPGEVFGEEALPGDAPRWYSAEAVEDSVVCVLRVARLRRLARDYPEFGLRLGDTMSRRLGAAHTRLADLVFKNIASRLAGFLIGLAERHGDGRLTRRITHQEIASRIGSTRETVTATLNEFKRRGFLTVRDRRLIITDHDSLQQIYNNNGGRPEAPTGTP